MEIVIISSDNEEFTISRQVAQKIGFLQPKLQEGITRVNVPLECLLLDYVIFVLENEVELRESISAPYVISSNLDFDTNKVDDLLKASKTLSIPSLESFCVEAQQRFKNARYFSWEEFCAHQKLEDFWVLIDDCIYDITKWINPNPLTNQIPHPGGKMPLQTARRDGTYIFEISHSTNESYKLLKNYFIGRLKPEDKHLVPPLQHLPSQSFYDYLHSYTDSYTKLHL